MARSAAVYYKVRYFLMHIIKKVIDFFLQYSVISVAIEWKKAKILINFMKVLTRFLKHTEYFIK
jgi:hypothetical protein